MKIITLIKKKNIKLLLNLIYIIYLYSKNYITNYNNYNKTNKNNNDKEPFKEIYKKLSDIILNG